jgi:hypothetical protein
MIFNGADFMLFEPTRLSSANRNQTLAETANAIP